jgi:hypothetical protein
LGEIMSKTAFYCQCMLERVTKIEPASIVRTVTFIPSEYASLGNIVKLKNDNDEWVDGWVIREAGPPIDAVYIEERERDYKRTRKASDI